MFKRWPCLLACALAVANLGAGTASARVAGSIIGWGGQRVVEQDAVEDLVAVASGGDFSLGLSRGGSISAWGACGSGGCDVPAPNADFLAIAATYSTGFGLRTDGTVVAWGDTATCQCDIPEPNTGFAAIAAGDQHVLGLKATGE